ncbi:hypothetical protein A8W25_26675 [Streptomyces sp. ERV7]|nr:hypothetical protein A8W25_26675 [Streptomyces sp. ERV7]
MSAHRKGLWAAVLGALLLVVGVSPAGARGTPAAHRAVATDQVLTWTAGDDITAPETAAKVDGDRKADGAYLGTATVTLSASDAGSGVDRIEYALADGAWQPYTTAFMVHELGSHAVRYRATDKAGNTSPAARIAFTVAEGGGAPGRHTGYRDLFDGTAKSFAKWQQVGGGSFALSADGSMTSGTSRDGLGMLWFPQRTYEDFSLKLRWRDDAPGTGNANSGVFVRFPWVHDHPGEPRPEWVAIKYGHEVQVLDRPDGDMYKTGSVYGFDRVGLAGAGVTPKGTWNDYEIRVVGQHYSVLRNGVLINEFDNTGGQVFTPPRSDDPGTDGRRFDAGYIGLQVHSATDVVSYRDIRIKEL